MDNLQKSANSKAHSHASTKIGRPFTMDMVMQEINRFADSEFRYADRSDDAAVQKMVRDARLRERVMGEVEEMKKKGAW
jgi:hypothetical protein